MEHPRDVKIKHFSNARTTVAVSCDIRDSIPPTLDYPQSEASIFQTNHLLDEAPIVSRLPNITSRQQR